ncbi:MAG TPA: hypothetical protein DCK76_07465 [Desulfotomaculum sp.]|nr:MAG: putative membrabe protein [Desulfotomaculum sp. 46_296]HAG11204.1 hypothetical protein [Desulfotomaculum sp.]HBY03166.1 hypothetical protein [Desulfotomaculum sp.]
MTGGKKYVLFCALFFLFGLTSGYQTKSSLQDNAGTVIQAENVPAAEYFLKTFPDKKIITLSGSDLNNDGKKDLVVIYKENSKKNRMLVVLNLPGKYQCTNSFPAPVSNQLITFRDIDRKPPVEFVVQGMKDAKVGYAVYRVEGALLEDLFGRGMNYCC